MVMLAGGFIVSIASIHQTSEKYTVLHSECMTQLMIYNLIHKLQVKLVCVLRLNLLLFIFELVAFLYYLRI